MPDTVEKALLGIMMTTLKIAVRDEFKFTLFENGLDFIARGVSEISNDVDKRNCKYGVIHLADGVELILKQRLFMEDWKLIFANQSRADQRLLESGNFKSVNLHEAITRLNDLAVSLPEASANILKTYGARRNAIRHFRPNETRTALVSASAQVISIILDFVRDELDDVQLEESESELLSILRRQLSDFEAFTKQRLANIGPALAAWQKHYGQIIDCPECTQQTLKADCTVECAFCAFTASAEKAADLYISNVIGYAFDDDDGPSSYPRYWCPECSNEAFVDEGDSKATCFACGTGFSDFRFCDDCNDPVADAETMFAGKCADCWRNFAAGEHR